MNHSRLKVFFNILFFIILIILLFYFLFNYKIYIVTSGSMEPTLEINELILVKKTHILQIGDIISFYDENLKVPVTHRITRISEDRFYTKGDFNNIEDLHPVTNREIIGKVIFHSYYLGTLYIKYKYFLLVILIMIIVLINIFPRKTKCYL